MKSTVVTSFELGGANQRLATSSELKWNEDAQCSTDSLMCLTKVQMLGDFNIVLTRSCAKEVLMDSGGSDKCFAASVNIASHCNEQHVDVAFRISNTVTRARSYFAKIS